MSTPPPAAGDAALPEAAHRSGRAEAPGRDPNGVLDRNGVPDRSGGGDVRRGGGRARGGLAARIGAALVANKLALVGVGVLVLIALFCFLGPSFYHTSPDAENLIAANRAPSAAHVLGTDDEGRDILARLMAGGRYSLELGLGVAVIATGFGALWGAVSGIAGGATDTVLMRLVDVFLAIPPLFVFIFLATIFRPTIAVLIVVVSVVSWLTPARLVRGETLSLRSREFVEASRLAGGRFGRIVGRHVIPNTLSAIVVNATFQVADAILVLATLSFLGFGPPSPAATWGGMLSEGINYLYDGYWWQVYPAGLIIVVTVVAVNFIGDALRDGLDPRQQRR
ncbi:MAG TPA: ABC transporter permease [Acidimicrobiales bacterium]|nr:ABC transporter permease [Acidimicrobiales bacterium]